MRLQNSTLNTKREKPRRKGNPTPRIKPGRQEDPEHLQRLRDFGCWACRMDGDGWREAEPHHPRSGGIHGPGTGQRADDRDAIPLCPDRHHNVQTVEYVSIHMNPIEFRAKYGTEAQIRDKVLIEIYGDIG